MSEDIRVTKNKHLTETAFLGLLQEKDFYKITVQDICERALISRSTFYSHYFDKYDLLEKLVSHYALMVENAVQEKFAQSGYADIQRSLTAAYQQFEQHREAFEVLFALHVAPNGDLERKVESILKKSYREFLVNREIKTTVPHDLLLNLFTVNVMALLKWVMKNGSAADISQLAMQMNQRLSEALLRAEQ